MPPSAPSRDEDLALTSILIMFALGIAVGVTPLALLARDEPRVRVLFLQRVTINKYRPAAGSPPKTVERQVPNAALICLQGIGVACACVASQRAARSGRRSWDHLARVAAGLGTLAFLLSILAVVRVLMEDVGPG